MTYEECLKFCTKRMCVMGSFPHEIEAAAKEMFEENEELKNKIINIYHGIAPDLPENSYVEDVADFIYGSGEIDFTGLDCISVVKESLKGYF